MTLLSDTRSDLLVPEALDDRLRVGNTGPETQQHGRRSAALFGRHGEARIVCAVSFATYASVAALLAFKYHVYPDDAVSRLANGFYVLYSADPHLAAMGFVWNPLQSLCDLVFLLLKDLWRPLATRDMAGGLVSALSMTGAVHQLRSALEERGLWRAPRLLLTVTFALSPMILFFAGNGMSEALYLFTLLATTRYLLQWQRDENVRSLVYAAAALALGYLARNEALGAGAAATVLVFGIAFNRVEGPTRRKIEGGLLDGTIFVLPLVVTVAVWATASDLLTGQIFPQVKANAVQVSSSGFGGGHIATRLIHELKAVESLAPLLPVVVVFALVTARRRRQSSVLTPLVVLGGGLGFDLVSYADGSLFPWLRYDILAIPIAVLCVGDLLATVLESKQLAEEAGIENSKRRAGRSRRRMLSFGASSLALGLLVPSFFTSSYAMLNKSIGAGETSEYLRPIFDDASSRSQSALNSWSSTNSIDSYLGGLHLGTRKVIVDNIDTCVPNLVVDSSNPKMFVIPNDRYYQRVAADPLTFKAEYFLLPPETGIDATGALAREYPSLYRNGNEFTQLVHQFPSAGLCPTFRLFKVLGHPPGIGGYG